MTLEELVRTSRALSATRSRTEKVERLVRHLRDLAPGERRAGTAYLCGSLLQGRIGLGHAAVRRACEVPALGGSAPALAEIDATLEQLSRTHGPGSASARAEALARLFGRASPEGRDFLSRLLFRARNRCVGPAAVSPAVPSTR